MRALCGDLCIGTFQGENLSSSGHSAGAGRIKRVLVFLLFLSAVFLRLYHMADKPLWADEYVQYGQVHARITRQIVKYTIEKDTRSPMALVVSGFFVNDRYPEWSMRLPSALASAGTVGAAWLLGSEFAGPWAGTALAVLTAFNFTQIYYAQEARPYALFTLFATLAMALFMRAWKRADPRTWLLAGMALTAALLTHFFALFLPLMWIGAAVILSIAQRDEKNILKRNWAFMAACLVVALALFSPWAARFAAVAGGDYGGGLHRLRLNSTLASLVLSRFGAGKPAAWLFAIAMLAGIFQRDRRNLVLTSWLVFPFVIISLVQLHHFFAIRYMLFLQPVFLLLAVMGIDRIAAIAARPRIRKSVLAWGMTGLLGAMAAVPVVFLYRAPAKDVDLEAIIRHVQKTGGKKRLVLCDSFPDAARLMWTVRRLSNDELPVFAFTTAWTGRKERKRNSGARRDMNFVRRFGDTWYLETAFFKDNRNIHDLYDRKIRFCTPWVDALARMGLMPGGLPERGTRATDLYYRTRSDIIRRAGAEKPALLIGYGLKYMRIGNEPLRMLDREALIDLYNSGRTGRSATLMLLARSISGGIFTVERDAQQVFSRQLDTNVTQLNIRDLYLVPGSNIIALKYTADNPQDTALIYYLGAAY